MHSYLGDSTKIQKRIFIGLLCASIIIIVGIIMSGVLIYFNRYGSWYKYTLIVILALLALFAAAVTFGIIGIVMTLWEMKSFFGMGSIMNISIRLLFPVAVLLGEVLHIPKDIIRSSFIEVNNKLTQSRKYRIPDDKILLLAPHCIQWWNCPYKVTSEATNCRHCGRCDIDKLLELSKQYGTPLVVVTGGTLARQRVKEIRPKAIVAIACERDLTEGILDINPLPVMGVLNIRPEGPCKNTCVDIGKVKNAIDFFAGRKEPIT